MSASAIPYGPENLMFLFIRNCAGTEVSDSMIDGKFQRRDGKFLHLDEEEIMNRANFWFEKFVPDLSGRRERNAHFARRIYPDYTPDAELDLQALL